MSIPPFFLQCLARKFGEIDDLGVVGVIADEEGFGEVVADLEHRALLLRAVQKGAGRLDCEVISRSKMPMMRRSASI